MMKRIMSIFIALIIMIYPMMAFGIDEVKPHEAAVASVVSITPSPSSHLAGNIQSVSLQVSTTNVANGTSITAALMASDGITPVSGVTISSGTVNSNAAALTLSIPAGIGAGSYKIKAGVDSLSINNSADYTILPGAQPNISSVSAVPNNHTTGTQQVVEVSISSTNVSNTPAVEATVQLVDGSGIPVPGVSAAKGTIVNNSATINLTIPSTIVSGSYNLKVTVASVSN